MKLFKRITFVAICFMFVTTLVSCISNISSAKKLEFYNQPKTEYLLNEGFESVIVKVTMNDNTTTLVELKAEDLEGFSTSTVGSFTARYIKDAISLSFDYVVVESLDAEFAGGLGTKEEPYEIATVAQFKNIGNHLESYFKLVASLAIGPNDFAIRGGDPVKFVVEGAVKGEIDFNGKTINVNTPDDENYMYTIFEYAQDGTADKPVVFKNLVLYVDNGFSFMYGYDDEPSSGVILYENITTEGLSEGGYNYALLMFYSFGNLTFKDCVNNADIIGIKENNAAFTGQGITETTGTIDFINCVNNGNIQSKSAAAFVANASDITRIHADSNCRNTGTITTLGGRTGKNAMMAIPGEFAITGSNAYDLHNELITEENLSSYPLLTKKSFITLTSDAWVDNQLQIVESNSSVKYYVVQLAVTYTYVEQGWTGRVVYSKIVNKAVSGTTLVGVYNYDLLVYDQDNHSLSYEQIIPTITVGENTYYTYVGKITDKLQLTGKAVNIFGYNEAGELVAIYNLQ